MQFRFLCYRAPELVHARRHRSRQRRDDVDAGQVTRRRSVGYAAGRGPVTCQRFRRRCVQHSGYVPLGMHAIEKMEGPGLVGELGPGRDQQANQLRRGFAGFFFASCCLTLLTRLYSIYTASCT